MANDELLLQEIREKQNYLKELKRSAQAVERRERALSSQPVVRGGGRLKQELKKVIPAPLMPQNVGHLNNVMWHFDFSANINLGVNPTISSATNATGSFQVSQESAFLFMSLWRSTDDYNEVGDLAPLQIEIRDRQSSRFFNDTPIPLQNIGKKSWGSYLPTPMIILPNAFVDVIMTSWLEPGINQVAAGPSTGFHQFTFGGYRLRVEDAKKVLSTIFG